MTEHLREGDVHSAGGTPSDVMVLLRFDRRNFHSTVGRTGI